MEKIQRQCRTCEYRVEKPEQGGLRHRCSVGGKNVACVTRNANGTCRLATIDARNYEWKDVFYAD